MTTQASVAEIASVLAAAGVENSQQEARWIVEDARDASEANGWARRRAAREPLQYVLGAAAFRNLRLEVGPGVFIPRPETEVVAGRAIELLPAGGVAVDLCTGSGAIALALADEVPGVTVHATEASEDALGWARRNAKDAVVLHRGDLFEPLPDDLKGTLDLVVSNPPYVSFDEAEVLPADVIDHEPHDALFSGPDGLGVIRRIIGEARSWLKPGGWLVLEIGETQGEAVESLLGDNGYRDVAIAPDLAGRDRIAEGRRP